METRIKSVANFAFTIIALLTLVAIVLWFVLPRVLGLQSQVVLTGSMEPGIPTGSVIFISSRAPAEVNIGDVLTFKHPGGDPNLRETAVITHRVVAIEGSRSSPSFRTRGDAGDQDDPWLVPSTHVIGIVEHHVPRAGYLTLWLQSRAGFFALTSVALLIIFWDDIVRTAERKMAGTRRRGEATLDDGVTLSG